MHLEKVAGRVGLFLRDEPYGRVVVSVDVARNRWDLLGPRP